MEVQNTKQQGLRQPLKSIMKHTLLMILCCLAPIAIILGLTALGVRNAFLSYAAVLVCPLSMVAMMLFMRKNHNGSGGHVH